VWGGGGCGEWGLGARGGGVEEGRLGVLSAGIA
jgi:hypothetical protein